MPEEPKPEWELAPTAISKSRREAASRALQRGEAPYSYSWPRVTGARPTIVETRTRPSERMPSRSMERDMLAETIDEIKSGKTHEKFWGTSEELADREVAALHNKLPALEKELADIEYTNPDQVLYEGADIALQGASVPYRYYTGPTAGEYDDIANIVDRGSHGDYRPEMVQIMREKHAMDEQAKLARARLQDELDGGQFGEDTPEGLRYLKRFYGTE